MGEEEKTERNLFLYNGSNYDMDKFISDARNGWASFANREIEDYRKHHKKYDEAFKDFIEGVSSGHIYRSDKRNGWIDKDNTRHNSGPKEKYDIYGAVATYFTLILKKLKPYLTPEEKATAEREAKKLDFNDENFAKIFNKALFDVEIADNDDWVYLNNAPDRKQIVIDALNSINFYDIFKNLDLDRLVLLNAARRAVIDALEDEQITDDEMRNIRKLSRSYPWKNFFGQTTALKNEETAATASQLADYVHKTLYESYRKLLDNYLKSNYKYDLYVPQSFTAEPPNGMLDFTLDDYNSLTKENIKKINRMFKRPNDSYANDDSLTNALYLVAFAERLIKLGVMTEDPDFGYLFPKLFLGEDADLPWYYRYIQDEHQIERIWKGDVNALDDLTAGKGVGRSYTQEGLIDAYVNDYINNQLLIPSLASGGMILKAEPGYKLPEGHTFYENPYDAIYGYGDVRYALSGTALKPIFTPRTTAATNNDNADTPEYDYVTINSIDNAPWRQRWVQNLTTDSDLAKKYAIGYYTWKHTTGKPNTYYKSWFDTNSLLLLDLEALFNFDKFKQWTNKSGKHIYNDNKVSIGYDVYPGLTYYINGEDGQKHYTKTIPEGWETKGDLTRLDLESGDLIDALELVPKASNQEVVDKSQGTAVANGLVAKTDGNSVDDELEIGALIEDILKKYGAKTPTSKISANDIRYLSVVPLLLSKYATLRRLNKKAYEDAHLEYTPEARKRFNVLEFGDERKRLEKYGLAAQLNTLADQNATNDQETNFRQRVSNMLKGFALQSEGDDADTALRLKTALDRLALDKQNMEWGIETGNKNLASLITTGNANALEKGRYDLSIGTLTSDLLTQFEKDLRQRNATSEAEEALTKEYQRLAYLDSINRSWDTREQLFKADYEKAHPGTNELNWIYDTDYLAVIRLFRSLRNKDLMAANIHGANNFVSVDVTDEEFKLLYDMIAKLITPAATEESTSTESTNTLTQGKHGGRLIPRKWNLHI